MGIDLATFQIDAVLCAANTALRLGDADAADEVRRAVEGPLGCRRSAPGVTRRASSPS
jgi:hypothetical protein